MDRLIAGLTEQGSFLFLGFVFVSVAFFSVAIGTLKVNWLDIRRRTAGGAGNASVNDIPGSGGLLTSAQGGSGALDGLLPKSETDKSELRRFLNMAGFYGAGTPAFYQLIRIVMAVAFGIGTASLQGRLFPNHPFLIIVVTSLVMTLLGYMLPRSIVSLRRDRLCDQHRRGFPDFLDLLVICIEAGIGIDSAMERVGRDLGRSYPSLAKNLGFLTLEMRAGRSTRDALDNLGLRLGIDEARSFARLIQQSEELGSSLVQSLRVYSDEMRAKRLSRAEEKAMALPAKLVIPLGLFIFPVILGVTLMPVALKLYKALGI